VKDTDDNVQANDAIREDVAKIFLSLATNSKQRGKIVQAGGMKALISLADHGSPKIQATAAHAIAKIAISTDPNLAFRDEISTRIVDPLMGLLSTNEEGLEQFEALMALTNLAIVGEETMQLIVRNNGLSKIEMLQLSSNTMLQRAASELMCNLVMFDEVFESYKTPSAERRLKIWGALCSSEDIPTAKASSGALATLSSDPEICQKIFEEVHLENLITLLGEEDPDLQHRAAAIIKNIVEDPKRAQVVASKEGIVGLMHVMTKSTSLLAKQSATEALEALSKLNLVLPQLQHLLQENEEEEDE